MSSTDRTEQYPEVSGEDSGLVPSIRAEWPKKLRTLTATELDRLTIDSGGRFYWDGHLVNYEPPKAPEVRPTDPIGVGALDLLDRAAIEITGKAPPPSEPKTSPEQPRDLDVHYPASPVANEAVPAETHAGDVTPAGNEQFQPAQASYPDQHAPAPDYPMFIAPTVQAPDKMRVALSTWQSVGLVLVIIGFLAAAAGVAAQGWVAANEWGCRIGAVKSHCPPPAPKAPARADIPA